MLVKLTSTYEYVDGGYGTNSTIPLVKKIAQNGISFEYEYDTRGNITSEKRGSLTTTYQYDALGQLIRVNDPHENATWMYNYDRGGNITSKVKYAYTTGTVGTAVETIPYVYGDSNWKDKLTSYNGQTITYDAIGNPTNDGTWTYTWQAGRQLKQMSAEGTSVSFKYDHNGMRVQKVVEQSWYPETTHYTYHGKLLTHMTVDYTDFDEVAHQDKLHFFYDEQNRPAKVEFNGTMYTYLHNMQGDIVGLLDSAGILMVEYKYDAWGKPLATTGSLAVTLGNRNPFRYRGYVFDEESRLYWAKNRYYNSELTRFIIADTIEAIQASVGTIANRNHFVYCDNNSVHRKDTNGAFWDTVFDIVSLAVSVCEVVANPADPWAWAGLAGDVIDLVPFVSGVGEMTRAVKAADKVGDTIKVQRAVDLTDDALGVAKTLDRSTGFTKSTRRAGRKIHRGYKVEYAGKGKEYNRISGIRPDYVDLENKIIYELKPFNPRSVKTGVKQLQKYNKKLGGGYTMILEVY